MVTAVRVRIYRTNSLGGYVLVGQEQEYTLSLNFS
jgi:hypothetical protein